METCNALKNRTGLAILSVMFLVMVLLISSCSDDFLYQPAPDTIQSSDTIFLTNLTTSFPVPFQVEKGGMNEWKVFQYPTWIDVEPMQGRFANGNSSFNLSVSPERFPGGYGYFLFPLVFDVSGVGLVEYTLVYLNLGNPGMQVPSSVNIGENSSGSFYIRNEGGGVLLWEITGMPSWLEITERQGLIEQHSEHYINFTVNRKDLTQGDYSGLIHIGSNSRQGPVSIPVQMKVVSAVAQGDVKYGDGDFVEARYSKATNQLLVLLANPAKLQFYTNVANNPSELSLNRVPRCMALSDDGTTVAIGFSNAEISLYDVASRQLLKTYPVDAIPLSIGLGENGWLYFPADVGYRRFIYSMNLETGIVNTSNTFESGIKPFIKVKNKPYLITTRPGYDPDGIQFIDIRNGRANDTIRGYHLSTYGIWISENGERVYTGNNKAYRLPNTFNPSNFDYSIPPVVGEYDLPFMPYTITCVADHVTTSKIYVARHGLFAHDNYATITQMDYHTFTKIKEYKYGLTRPENWPVFTTWWMKTQYIFPYAGGNQLWLVHRYPPPGNDKPEGWAIERISFE
jgi:hypothetical protein